MSSSLAITAFGMTTAVGHDAATSCASIRAGISRAQPIVEAKVLDPDAQLLIAATGHAVWGLTDGASAVARWLNLAESAIDDLCQSAKLPDANDHEFWSRTAVALITPVLDDDRLLFSLFTHPLMITESYVEPLLAAVGKPFIKSHVYLLSEGRTGALRALADAENLFARGEVDRLLVLAADSYLDGFSLQWLNESERLKAAEQPTGLMPGEAAVALMIERAVGQACKARIRTAVVDQESGDYANGERRHGRALARGLRNALKADATQPFAGDLLVDLNGEAWRAYEFGAALAQLSSEQLGAFRSVIPAMSTGDVGAASSLLAIAMAARAFERGYASAETALVASTSYSGRVGAALLNR